MKQRLISIDELARITDTEPSWWQVRIRHGEIPVVKLGRHVRLRLQDVEGILDRGYPPRRRHLKAMGITVAAGGSHRAPRAKQ